MHNGNFQSNVIRKVETLSIFKGMEYLNIGTMGCF